MAYVSLQQQQQQFLGKPGQNNQTGGMKLQTYTPLSQQQESYLKTDTGQAYKPISSSTTKQQPQQSAYQKAGPVRQAISNAAGAYMNVIKNLPEAHFADKLNFFTPLGFVANLAQGLINTPAEALKGAQSLGQHAKAGTSTPQQVVGDVAAAVQLPLLLLTGGTSSVAKEGIVQTVKNTAAQGIKGAVKAVAKEGAIGGGYGLLSGFQSGKNITSVSDYVKNLLQNVGIGAAAGAGFGTVTHVALPLAKGLTSKTGAIFIKNVDKTPVIEHVQIDPKVAQSTVLGNEGLSKTLIGKEILKQSVVASNTDRHVTITPSKDGKFALPNGSKVDIGTAHIYDPTQHENNQIVKDKNGLSVQDYVNAKESKFRLSDPRTTESMLSQAEKAFVENFKGSSELWNDISTDPSKETIERSINWLSNRDPNMSRDVFTQRAIKLATYIDSARKNVVVNAPPEMGIEMPAATKYRLKDDFANKGIKITDEQEQNIVDLNKKIFGDTDVKVTSQILTNGKALGAYREGIIKILDGQGEAKDTYLHEVVHKYLDLFTNKQEHMDILLEGEKHYKLNDYAQVEEKLAEDFIKYTKDREGVTGQLRLHFDNLILRIKKYLGSSSKIEELYNEILNSNKESDNGKVPGGIAPEVKSSTTSQQPVGTGKPRESEAFSKFVDNLKDADPKRYEELKDGKITYNRLNLENDAKNAMKLVEKDPQQAYRIAKGIESAPAGQTETAISIALADRAGKEKDYKLQSELESSRSLRQTRRGQEIVSERGRFTDTSPYHYIQQLIDTRMKKVGGSLLSKIQEEIPGQKTSAKKAAVERVDREVVKVKSLLTKEQRKIKLAQNILDSLTCK